MNSILGGSGSNMGDGPGNGPGNGSGDGQGIPPESASPGADDGTLIGGQGAGGAAAGELIKDVTTATFMADVIEASRDVPVIVDFWAPWCEPCKQLGPVLEKLVQEAGGKVKLAKVDIDQNQALASQLRIQSIPMVYAFFGGRPVDGFQGALPESQLKQFIDNLVTAAGGQPGDDNTAAIAEALEQGREALAKGDEGTAMGLFSSVLEREEKNVDALAGMARCYIKAGEAEAAQAILDELPEEAADNPEVEAARAALELSSEGAKHAGETEELKAKVEADANDHQARFDLALSLLAAGQREGAVEHLLEIVKRKRDWNDHAARKQLVKMFEAWGPEDPLTVESRQRLSAILFA